MSKRLIIGILVVLVLVSGCDDSSKRIVKYKIGGLSVSFNGEEFDGITALCDFSIEEKKILSERNKIIRKLGYSDKFDNYEFLGYFYSDLINVTQNSQIFINETQKYASAFIPHFAPGKIRCYTYKVEEGFETDGGVFVYFFFAKDLQKEEILGVLQKIKMNLEKRWYVESTTILGRMVAIE